MKRFWLGFLLLELLFIPPSVIGQEVLVYEAWLAHMESVGGWVAAEQGLNGKVKVKEIQGGSGISPIHQVVVAVRGGPSPSEMTTRRISSGPTKRKVSTSSP